MVPFRDGGTTLGECNTKTGNTHSAKAQFVAPPRFGSGAVFGELRAAARLIRQQPSSGKARGKRFEEKRKIAIVKAAGPGARVATLCRKRATDRLDCLQVCQRKRSLIAAEAAPGSPTGHAPRALLPGETLGVGETLRVPLARGRMRERKGGASSVRALAKIPKSAPVCSEKARPKTGARLEARETYSKGPSLARAHQYSAAMAALANSFNFPFFRSSLMFGRDLMIGQ